MAHRLLALAAVAAALVVIAGAFGAHALESRLDARALELWETAARYLMFSALGLAVVSLAAGQLGSRAVGIVATSLAAGGAIFSGTLFAMALGAPRWLGAVTPLGGLGLIFGWLALAVAAFRRRNDS